MQWTNSHDNAFRVTNDFLLSKQIMHLPTGMDEYHLFCDGTRSVAPFTNMDK